MAKAKNKLFLVLTLVALIALGTVLLASCDQTADSYTVTFMVRENGTGEYQQYGNPVQSDKEGKVTLPSQPEVDGYVFRNWYTDENCTSGNEFDGTGVKSNMTVYALMVEQEVTLSLTDGEGNSSNLESTSLANLSEVTAEQESAAQAVNLTFDGWYTDSDFTQKYSDGMDATALYGRYMAQITYDNGYETLYTELVTPGTLASAPDERVDDFVKRYMDDEDISYQDAEGNAIDFASDAFNANTVVTVLWKTPGLVYTANEGQNDKYYVSNIDNDDYITYPVISFLSKDVNGVDRTGNAVSGDVLGVVFDKFGIGLNHSQNATKIMFADGIEYIKGLQMDSSTGMSPSQVKEIVFPSTLKILEQSVWGFGSLEGLTLPESLEVVIDCFWKNHTTGLDGFRNDGYDFSITIPASVTDMSLVPANLDLSENSLFEYENGRLYKVDNNSKILCSEYQSNITDERLIVEEGVTGITVGILNYLEYSYLSLPSTFCEVGYHNPAENYNCYTGSFLTASSIIDNPNNVPDSSSSSLSYAIVGNLDALAYVMINQTTTSLPEGVSDYAFVSTSGSPYNSSEFLANVKVVFVGEVATGNNIFVQIIATNTRNNTTQVFDIDTLKSGDSLTASIILQTVGLSDETAEYSITSLCEAFADGAVTTNQYINIDYITITSGYTYEINEDGKTATVTGFDQDGAEILDSGLYRVNIPSKTPDGYTITAIEEEAFMGESSIQEIYIANTVQSIGARAFMNTSNLELVDIAAGNLKDEDASNDGLKTIGESAFENIGCIYTESTGEWTVNEELPEVTVINRKVPAVTVKIPLANLESVGAYAFKSLAIATFAPVEGEENRYICYGLKGALTTSSYIESKLEEGGFYWYMSNAGNSYMGILQYVKQGTETASDGEEVTVIDARLIAIAGGDPTTGYTLHMGISMRAASFASRLPILKTAVVRFEVMTGSVYFINSAIEFGIVSKVHTNAFTDMRYTSTGEQKYNTIYWYGPEGDTWLSQEDLQSQNSVIFEDGWWEGIPNSQNTVTSNAKTDGNTILGQ